MADKFHVRFQITIPLEEAKRRFINRARNELLDWGASWNESSTGPLYPVRPWPWVCRLVATEIGETANETADAFELYTHSWDFEATLRVLEALNKALPSHYEIGSDIQRILSLSEIDPGIRWENGYFLPSGAEILDDSLIDRPLAWLREKTEYQTVLAPLTKALDHLLRARAKPELLADVITDAYEALEALAMIVCGNSRTLDCNRELFIKRVNASEGYKRILKEYIEFAHIFRHGAAELGRKTLPAYAETESFVYLTGLFIRLAISAGFVSSAAE